MDTGLEPQDLTFDAYTLCSFLPNLPNGEQHARAIPLVVIGYRQMRIPRSSGSFRKRASTPPA